MKLKKDGLKFKHINDHNDHFVAPKNGVLIVPVRDNLSRFLEEQLLGFQYSAGVKRCVSEPERLLNLPITTCPLFALQSSKKRFKLRVSHYFSGS